jgi:hypothetical protein
MLLPTIACVESQYWRMIATVEWGGFMPGPGASGNFYRRSAFGLGPRSPADFASNR